MDQRISLHDNRFSDWHRRNSRPRIEARRVYNGLRWIAHDNSWDYVGTGRTPYAAYMSFLQARSFFHANGK
jgi:hypothetical protein